MSWCCVIFVRERNLDIGESKASVVEDIDARYQQLGELSRKIHGIPEVAFQEFKAAAWLTEYLEENGFSVERGICELPTAFRGSYGTGKPVIAFLAEYDALPKLGHACGHNLIAACAVGAGVASKRAVDRFGGSIMVIGTPGEELYGGKVIMADKGAFSNLDVAMIVHPGNCDTATTEALACQGITVDFVINSEVVHGVPVSPEWVLQGLAYAVYWLVLLLAVAIFLFRRKDLQ